ncbi:hypothetical protein QQ020_05390 [Fulvivirgaceae bacterium BMA12]|uniref:Uncharacterized protein n=1 Tax=Agaribacillus aureus TaxID=3051825 RepID=A0ABT8L1B1_9BACT|nr:hypothetical protein [Fulvivirgaceae bacterium BMA12]
MRFAIKVILIAILAFLLQQVMPWWIIALVCFFVTLVIKSSGFTDFMAGFLGIGLLWLLMAWWIDHETNSMLTTKIAQLLGVGQAYIVILATGLIGSIVGGLAALSGHFVRKSFT